MHMRLIIISISITTIYILCDARSFPEFTKPLDTEQRKSNSISTHETEQRLRSTNHLDLNLPLPSSSSIETLDLMIPPFSSSPPLDYSLAPLPLPANNHTLTPFSAYPPHTKIPPPSGPAYGPSPHPPSPISIPPINSPSPPIILPPIVFPPPAGPPSPPTKKPPQSKVWCVAKPTVPDPIVQEAMDYACGSGADCKSIQPNGPCYKPDNVLSHASYAFNSYWQSTKIGGGTCDFGGTAMLVTIDPSFDGCPFFYNYGFVKTTTP